MDEKQLEEVGRFVAKTAAEAEESAFARATEETLTVVGRAEKSFDDKLENFLILAGEAAETKTKLYFDQTALGSEAQLASALAAVRDEMGIAAINHGKALGELRDNLDDALHELNDEQTTRHQAEIAVLAEQVKAQEVFEAQLTQRLAEIKDGEKGDQGEQGEAGIDGLDRPLLEPVELVAERTYPKNTLGTHAGGLWIATKEALGCPESDPHAWACVLDAMTEVDFELGDDQQVTMSVRTSTGQVHRHTNQFPFMTYDDVWEEGKSYTTGQVVTKGASLWIAKQDTADSPPGNGWKQILHAKQGKPGPRGEKGEPGQQGVPGRNGLDAQLPDNFVEDIRAVASERKAFEDGRSGAYAITSHRGYFLAGERYNAGDTVDQMGSIYLCTSAGSWEKFSDAVGSFELFVNVPQQAPLPPYSLWRGEWASGNTYDVGNMVRDGAWLMCANTKTQDRPAPQAIGSPDTIYKGTSPTTQELAKSLTHGALYTVVTPVWINGYRIYTITGNNYRTYSITNGGEISELLSFQADSTGWAEFTLSPIPLAEGSTFALLSVVAEPDPSPISITGDWDYDTPNNPSNPGVGEIVHANNESSVLRINKTDDNGGDRSAELEALTLGDIIDSGNIRWAIQTIADNGTWMGFGIAPATQDAPDGVREFTFETVTATPITYLRDDDYYAAEPAVQGLLGIDIPPEDIVPDDSGYGVDLIIQAASVSPDWDMMAYSATLAGDNGANVAKVSSLVDEAGQGGQSQRVERLEEIVTLLVGMLP